MRGSYRKSETEYRAPKKEIRTVGDLDLVNLRLDLPSEREELKSRFQTRGGSGDNTLQKPQFRQSNSPHIPHISPRPKDYYKKPDDGVVVLYSKESSHGWIKTEPLTDQDFLVPSRRKSKTQDTSFQLENYCCSRENSLDSKRNNFPFKTTPSGKLKVESSQVVFASEQLSVLVADPRKTRVNIQADPFRLYSHPKMAQKAPMNSTKSAMEAFMAETAMGSLGSLMGKSVPRSPVKESSEYQSKNTSEILDPEVTLERIGYNKTVSQIDWDKVRLPEKRNLYLELYNRISSNKNADCKVYVENEGFDCHLIVLQCYSELFDAYVAVKKVELPADKVSIPSFTFIYNWMITGEPSYANLNRNNVLDIFISAKYMKVKDLIEQCWAFIDNVEVFNEDTAFFLYKAAKIRNLPEVQQLMLPRIQKFFLTLVSTEDWLELDIDDAKSMANSNYIGVNCEMEVFMSAVRWLKHDWETREKYKYDLMECVRFGNIAPWQLVDIKRNPENPDFMELASDLKICKMIDDGIAYVIIKYWYGLENNDDFNHWNSNMGLEDPPARNWTDDGSNKTYFTFREFLIELDLLRRNHVLEQKKSQLNDKKNERSIYTNSPRIYMRDDKSKGFRKR